VVRGLPDPRFSSRHHPIAAVR